MRKLKIWLPFTLVLITGTVAMFLFGSLWTPIWNDRTISDLGAFIATAPLCVIILFFFYRMWQWATANMTKI